MAASQPKTLAVNCPKCGAAFEIGVELAGMQGRCQCGHVFVLPAVESPPPALTRPKREPPPDFIGVSCRICQTRMFGRPDQVGRALKCPDCGALTALPPRELAKPTPPPAAMEGEQYELWGVDEGPSNSELLAAEPKYIAVECRMCRTLMHATLEHVGKKIKCPDCGTVHVVPPPDVPKAAKSVLTPDGEGYELEEAPTLLEPPPVIVPPRRPMLYEEERDAEIARQDERKQRGDTRGLQYDVHGRPVMPRFPLVTRVLPFLFSRGVPVRWAALSAGLFVVLVILSLGLGIIGPAGGPQQTGLAVIGGVCLGVFAALVGMIWLAALSSFVIAIVTESSEGNDEVQDWPTTNFADWLAYLLAMLVATSVSVFPGWLVGQFFLDSGPPRLLAAAASVFLCFPIVLLSQLDIGSTFGVVSGRLLVSLAKCPFSWLLFYLEIATLAAICGAVLLSETQLGLAAVFLEIPFVVAAMLLAARLLGRLAWKLAETMPAVETVSAKETGGA